MDRLFIIFILAVVFFGGLIVAYESLKPAEKPNIQRVTTSTTTSYTTSTTSTTSTTLSTPATTQTTITTTTTTLPRYVELEYSDVSKCRSTVFGGMNTVVAYISGETLQGDWGPKPDPKIYYDCDGERRPFDKVGAEGGSGIESGKDLEGKYRLTVKCGRNQIMEDLKDCRELKVVLDTLNVNIASVDGEGVAGVVYTTTTSTSSSTSTTLYNNPYLDKFRGKGYHKADLSVHWLCPTCVPAVNKLVMGEPGVKSRSLGYRQKLSYIIYDPDVVDLERVIEVAGAGGDVELIEDYEI